MGKKPTEVKSSLAPLANYTHWLFCNSGLAASPLEKLALAIYNPAFK